MQTISAIKINSFKERLGVVTDEIDQDLESALEITRKMGLRYVDLNTLWGQNIVRLTDSEIERAAGLLKAVGIETKVLCTPCFKGLSLDQLGPGPLNKQEPFLEHLRDLKRGMEISPIFDADLVRVFSFRRPNISGLGNPSPRLPLGCEVKPEDRRRIVEGLSIAAETAADHGITLVLENVRSCYADSSHNAAILLEQVGSDHLRCLWDPCNSFVSGQYPYPQGYLEVKPFIEQIHLKNASVLDNETGLTRWEPIGEGEVDFLPLIRSMIMDGFDKTAMLETHWAPEGLKPAEATLYSFQTLLQLLDKLSAQ